MTEVAADLPALDAFSDQTVGRRDRLEQVRHGMDAVHVPRDAFGYIPGIGGRTQQAYEDFVSGCVTVLDEVTEAVYALSRAVRDASEAYAAADQSSADTLNSTGELHRGIQ